MATTLQPTPTQTADKPTAAQAFGVTGPSSPIEPMMTCLTDVLARTFSSTCAKFSRMMMASAPESLS